MTMFKSLNNSKSHHLNGLDLAWIGSVLFIAASVAELVLNKMYPYAVASKEEPVYRYMLILIGVWWTGLILICAGGITFIGPRLLPRIKTKVRRKFKKKEETNEH